MTLQEIPGPGWQEADELRWSYAVIDAYVPVPEGKDWATCPRCGVRPRIWEFDNGRFAKCRCSGKWDPASVSAISIGAVWRRDQNTAAYDNDELRKNWNLHIANL